MKKVDDRWEKYNENLGEADLEEEGLGFLNHPIIRKTIVMPLKKNDKLQSNVIDIMNFRLDLTGSLDILEVGGGFGGLCKALHNYTEIGSYTLLDTPEMLRFAEKFLGYFNINANLIPANSFRNLFDKKFDLFISNICLSETPKEYRKELLDNVLPNCKTLFVLNAGYKAHPLLDDGNFNVWLEQIVRSNFDETSVTPISPHVCYQKHIDLYLGKK